MKITTYGLLPIKMKEARVNGVVIHHTLDYGFPAVFAVETTDSYALDTKKTKAGAESFCDIHGFDFVHTCSILGCTCCDD